MRVVQRFPIKGDSSEIAQKASASMGCWNGPGNLTHVFHSIPNECYYSKLQGSSLSQAMLPSEALGNWDLHILSNSLSIHFAWFFFFFSYISSVPKKREKDFSKVVIYDFPFSDHDLNGVLKNLSLSVTFLLSAPLNSPESYQITILVSTITATIVKSYWHSSSQGMKFSFHFIKIKQVVAWLIVMSQHVLND